MPTYDYYCPSCGHEQEILEKMTDSNVKECPTCKAETFIRQIGRGIGLHFNCGGFYCTDYN